MVLYQSDPFKIINLLKTHSDLPMVFNIVGHHFFHLISHMIRDEFILIQAGLLHLMTHSPSVQQVNLNILQ